MKRLKGRLPPLPRYIPLEIKSLDDIKQLNEKSIQRIIDESLRCGPYGEPGYIYMFTVVGFGIKIGCTQRHPKQRMKEQYKDFVKDKPIYWRCRSFQLAEFLIHKFLDYCRMRDPGSKRPIELFNEEREVAERVCETIIEALEKNMEKKESEEDEDKNEDDV